MIANATILDAFCSNLTSHLQISMSELYDTYNLDKSKPFSKQDFKLLNIFNRLNITLDSVVEGNIDFNSIIAKFNGQSLIPKKYLKSIPLSSRFTGMYMLDYIEKNHGNSCKNMILQHLQLADDNFSNLSEKNNILLPYDICNYIYKYSNKPVVKEMGAHSMNFLANTHIGTELTSSKNIIELFENLVLDLGPKIIEKNFNWKIDKLDSFSCTISGKPKEELVINFGKETISNAPLEVLRLGFYETVPGLIGHKNAIVVQETSLSGGAKFDRYKIYFNNKTTSDLKH